jgi:UDP-N-acetylmuramyl pentapeptide phosphotransferase/UDP-N-acetylglucosamine-1-phosphate transferase
VLAPPAVPGGSASWLAATGVVAVVSFADDARGVPVGARLVVHLGAAATLAWLVFGSAPEAALAAFAIAWGANLYNFMDGSDGLAGTMTVAGFGAYAVVALASGAPWATYAAIAVATLPFLHANRPPARMFMGDVGAVPIGLLAAGFGAAGVQAGAWPAWFPLLAFLPFLADATVTLGLRALRGERVWEAHRSHFYQRLVLTGAGHRGTLAVYAALMLACAALAVVCALLRPDAGWAALAVASAGHAGLFGAIVYHGRKNAPGTG